MRPVFVMNTCSHCRPTSGTGTGAELGQASAARKEWILAGALASTGAGALAEPLGAVAKWAGALLAALVGVALAGGVFYLASEYGETADAWAALVTAALLAAAGLVGGWLLRKALKEPVKTAAETDKGAHEPA